MDEQYTRSHMQAITPEIPYLYPRNMIYSATISYVLKRHVLCAITTILIALFELMMCNFIEWAIFFICHIVFPHKHATV